MNRHQRRATAAKPSPAKVRCVHCKRLRPPYFIAKEGDQKKHYCEACWNGGERERYLAQLEQDDPRAYRIYQAVLLAGRATQGEIDDGD